METELSFERRELAAAILAVDDARDDAKHLEDLLNNANKMLADLLSKWGQHSTLDDEIAKARAAATVSAIERGERPSSEEPAGFASRKVSRDAAEGELASVRNAIPLLERQLEDAKQKIETRQYEVDMRAEAVFAAEAEDMATRYLEELRALRETLYMLRYYGVRQVRRDPQAPRPQPSAMVYNPNAAPTRQIAMPKIVLEACGEDCLGSSEMRGGVRVRENVSAAVAQYWQHLRVDPTAQLEIAPLPKPFDPTAMLQTAERDGLRGSKSWEPKEAV